VAERVILGKGKGGIIGRRSKECSPCICIDNSGWVTIAYEGTEMVSRTIAMKMHIQTPKLNKTGTREQ
jgi:hypothetical protein